MNILIDVQTSSNDLNVSFVLHCGMYVAFSSFPSEACIQKLTIIVKMISNKTNRAAKTVKHIDV